MEREWKHVVWRSTVCKCHAKLDRKDQLQLRGLKLLCVVTAWVRYVYFLQKTLVTLVLLWLSSTVRMLTRVENYENNATEGKKKKLLLFCMEAEQLSVWWLYKLSWIQTDLLPQARCILLLPKVSLWISFLIQWHCGWAHSIVTWHLELDLRFCRYQ